jgi:dihydrofolate reductase
MPVITLVVAMARNRVIGRDNTLPWHLPADLRHFKTVTLGKPVLMGRKTFDSIGKPLPGRTNLILTRDPDWRAAGTLAVHSVEAALEYSRPAPELAAIGGAEIFNLLLPRAARIHLTRVEAEIPGDTLFPTLDRSQWLERDCRTFVADERNAYDMTFITLERAPADAH